MNPQVPNTPYPELASYYNAAFQAPLSAALARVQTGQAAAAEDQRQFDVKRQLSDVQNKNYQRVAKADGGYGFYDPTGNEVSAYDYARAIGKNVADVLSDSDNPIDIGFAQDYKNLQDFMQAAVTGDKEALDTFYSENPGLKTMSPQQVLAQFRKSYPTVYGGNKPGVPVGQTYIPSLSAVRNNQDYFANGGDAVGA